MTTVATAPGKMLLIGEYAVLEGAPALVMAVNRRAEVTARPAAQFALRAPQLGIAHDAPFTLGDGGAVCFADAALQEDARLNLLRATVAVAWEHAQGRLAACHLAIDTAPFLLEVGGPKLGLGSSAAVGVALLAALLAQSAERAGPNLQTEAGRQALFALALTAHARSQAGLGSGADVAASVWGGFVRFQRPRQPDGSLAAPQVHPVAPLAQAVIVPVWAGAPASTQHLVGLVAAAKASLPVQYWEILEKLAIYATAGVEFWTLGNMPALLTVINAYHDTMYDLGVLCGAPIVTAAHADLQGRAKACDVAYKPSGAGGGDVGFALCPSAAASSRLLALWKAQGYRIIPMQVAEQGVQTARVG